MSSIFSDAAFSFGPPPPIPLPLPISLPVIAYDARRLKRPRIDLSPPPSPPRPRSPVSFFPWDDLLDAPCMDYLYLPLGPEAVRIAALSDLTERKEKRRMELATAEQQRDQNQIKLTEAIATAEVARQSAADCTSLAASDINTIKNTSFVSVIAAMAAQAAIADARAATITVFDCTEIDAAAHGSSLDKHAASISLSHTTARARVAEHNTLARAARQSLAKSAVAAAKLAVAEEARKKSAAVAAASRQAAIDAATACSDTDSFHARYLAAHERMLAELPTAPLFIQMLSKGLSHGPIIPAGKTSWVNKSSRRRVPVVSPILASPAPAISSVASQSVIASSAADSAYRDRRSTQLNDNRDKAAAQSQARVAMEDTPKEEIARVTTVIAIELPIAAATKKRMREDESSCSLAT